MKKIILQIGIALFVGIIVVSLGHSWFKPTQTTPTTQIQTAPTIDDGKHDATDVYKKVSKMVVTVQNLQDTHIDWANDLTQDEGNLSVVGEGSGVVVKVDQDTSYLITNHHVIADATKIQLLLTSGQKITAEVVLDDSQLDLALLKVKSDQLQSAIDFANFKKIKTGQTVYAIGSPNGATYASSMTKGIISATKREIQVDVDTKATVLQTDTAINPGNSGGPLVNTQGQLVGINSMKLTQTSSGKNVEGIGFAIPIDIVTKFIAQLK